MEDDESATNQTDETIVTDGVDADRQPAPERDHAEGEHDDHDHDAEGDEGQGDDDTEEVEHAGKKYRLPKALNAERMMQADYTRKTTEHAEQRRVWEQQRTQEAQAVEQLREDYGRAHSLKAQVKAYGEIDWNAWSDASPAEAQGAWMQYQQAKEALGTIEGELSNKAAARLQSQQQAAAKAMEETGRALAHPETGIKGWGVEKANQLADYAMKQFGVSQTEVREMSDPRIWKLLDRAMGRDQVQRRQAAVTRQDKLQAVTPAKTVGAKPPATGLRDSSSTAGWMERRNAQLAKRR